MPKAEYVKHVWEIKRLHIYEDPRRFGEDIAQHPAVVEALNDNWEPFAAEREPPLGQWLYFRR